jgi:hypothetical protein
MQDWASVVIPFTRSGFSKWPNNNKNLLHIKAMLTQDGLINGADYVISPEYFNSQITLRFREPQNASYYLLKWVSSDWYNNT